MDILSLAWNVSQDSRLRNVEDAAGRTDRNESSEVALELRLVVERLALVSQAMWELLSERAGVSETDLLAKVQEVDMRDGHQDGRRKRAPLKCGSCGKLNGVARARCLYCNEKLSPPTAFDTVRP